MGSYLDNLGFNANSTASLSINNTEELEKTKISKLDSYFDDITAKVIESTVVAAVVSAKVSGMSINGTLADSDLTAPTKTKSNATAANSENMIMSPTETYIDDETEVDTIEEELEKLGTVSDIENLTPKVGIIETSSISLNDTETNEIELSEDFSIATGESTIEEDIDKIKETNMLDTNETSLNMDEAMDVTATGPSTVESQSPTIETENILDETFLTDAMKNVDEIALGSESTETSSPSKSKFEKEKKASKGPYKYKFLGSMFGMASRTGLTGSPKKLSISDEEKDSLSFELKTNDTSVDSKNKSIEYKTDENNLEVIDVIDSTASILNQTKSIEVSTETLGKETQDMEISNKDQTEVNISNVVEDEATDLDLKELLSNDNNAEESANDNIKEGIIDDKLEASKSSDSTLITMDDVEPAEVDVDSLVINPGDLAVSNLELTEANKSDLEIEKSESIATDLSSLIKKLREENIFTEVVDTTTVADETQLTEVDVESFATKGNDTAVSDLEPTATISSDVIDDETDDIEMNETSLKNDKKEVIHTFFDQSISVDEMETDDISVDSLLVETDDIEVSLPKAKEIDSFWFAGSESNLIAFYTDNLVETAITTDEVETIEAEIGSLISEPDVVEQSNVELTETGPSDIVEDEATKFEVEESLSHDDNIDESTIDGDKQEENETEYELIEDEANDFEIEKSLSHDDNIDESTIDDDKQEESKAEDDLTNLEVEESLSYDDNVDDNVDDIADDDKQDESEASVDIVTASDDSETTDVDIESLTIERDFVAEMKTSDLAIQEIEAEMTDLSLLIQRLTEIDVENFALETGDQIVSDVQPSDASFSDLEIKEIELKMAELAVRIQELTDIDVESLNTEFENVAAPNLEPVEIDIFDNEEDEAADFEMENLLSYAGNIYNIVDDNEPAVVHAFFDRAIIADDTETDDVDVESPVAEIDDAIVPGIELTETDTSAIVEDEATDFEVEASLSHDDNTDESTITETDDESVPEAELTSDGMDGSRSHDDNIDETAVSDDEIVENAPEMIEASTDVASTEDDTETDDAEVESPVTETSVESVADVELTETDTSDVVEDEATDFEVEASLSRDDNIDETTTDDNESVGDAPEMIEASTDVASTEDDTETDDAEVESPVTETSVESVADVELTETDTSYIILEESESKAKYLSLLTQKLRQEKPITNVSNFFTFITGDAITNETSNSTSSTALNDSKLESEKTKTERSRSEIEAVYEKVKLSRLERIPLKQLKLGSLINGTVAQIMPYGAFVQTNYAIRRNGW